MSSSGPQLPEAEPKSPSSRVRTETWPSRSRPKGSIMEVHIFAFLLGRPSQNRFFLSSLGRAAVQETCTNGVPRFKVAGGLPGSPVYMKISGVSCGSARQGPESVPRRGQTLLSSRSLFLLHDMLGIRSFGSSNGARILFHCENKVCIKMPFHMLAGGKIVRQPSQYHWILILAQDMAFNLQLCH